MSATLTWKVAGPQTSTGTTIGAMFTDLKSLIDSKIGDSTYPWQVASSNLGSTPYQITLKPKSGAAGRILIVHWSSTPAGTNSAILDTTPTASSVHIAFFPSGNVDTPSNLTAASGTIMGNDTGVVKCAPIPNQSTSYSTGYQWYMAMSAEACYFFTGTTSGTTPYVMGAGYILVDGSDNEYAACFGGAASSTNFGSSGTTPAWTPSVISAGGNSACWRTNYGSSNRAYFLAWMPSGGWGAQPQSSTDIVSDSANSRMYFFPIQLIGQTKGEGVVLKVRQMAIGPGTVAGPFQLYNTTGPTPAAYQMNSATAGSAAGNPWLVNFKL